MRRSSVPCRRALDKSRRFWPARAGDVDQFRHRSRAEDDAMSSRTTTGAPKPDPRETERLLVQYGCGPVQFTGTGDALYERHLLFDNVVDPADVGARERY